MGPRVATPNMQGGGTHSDIHERGLQRERFMHEPRWTNALWAEPQKKHKKWLQRKHEEEGLCYLLLYKRKYRRSAYRIYGRNPSFHHLDLGEEYLSNSFAEVNIAVNYPACLIHVYRTTKAIYQRGFEKWRDNGALLRGGWNRLFVIGATIGSMTSETEGYESFHEDAGLGHTMLGKL